MVDEQKQKFHISEIECKSILNRSKIPDLDYAINPYTGCMHGCVYCYAKFMARYTKHGHAWGRFTDVKINAVDVLKKQLARHPEGIVSLSTVTDPYQAVEKKYELTRRILKELADSNLEVSILTRSDLVVRDMDILTLFPREQCETGFSMATMDDEIRKKMEPAAPSIARRIEALRQLYENGIRTWVFLAPVMPVFTEATLFQLLESIASSVDYILVDSLNMKSGNWSGIKSVLKRYYPDILPLWESLLFNPAERRAFYQRIYGDIAEFCHKNNVQVRFC